MDFKKNRLLISGLAFVALAGLAGFLVWQNTGDTPVDPGARPTNFPDLDKDDLTEVSITRPGQPEIRLVKTDGTWRIAAPIQFGVEESAVDSMLERLDELEAEDVVSRRTDAFEELEVDDAHAIHVVAKVGSETRADLFIGSTRSGNTMVRVAGQEQVVAVSGAIRFAFDRELRDWRNKSVTRVTRDHVASVSFQGPNGSFEFTRPVVAGAAEGAEAPAEGASAQRYGDWQVVSANYTIAAVPDAGVARPRPMTTLPTFAPSQLDSIITTLADLRATDFAETSVTPEAAGFSASSPRVTLRIAAPGTDQAQQQTLILGREVNAESHDFYLMREGDSVIYIVTQYVSQRVHPSPDRFQQSAASAAPAAPPPAPAAGPGGQELPPDVMRQVQEMMRNQGAGQ